MTALEKHLHGVVKRYFIKHMQHPKSLSIGVDVYYQMVDLCCFAPLTIVSQQDKNLENALFWNGLPVKVVRRRGYVEAMPRRKPLKKGEITIWNTEIMAEPWEKMMISSTPINPTIHKYDPSRKVVIKNP